MKHEETASLIIEKALQLGASLAGIADIALLRDSPSYRVCGQPQWSEKAKSVLVLALIHETSEPLLDWWDDKKGGTPGNRQLMSISKELKKWLKENETLGTRARSLPYHVEKGGIFLKDAAVLAGLGIVGKNNLLITPGYGPRVRLRALFLDTVLESTGPIEFTPCDGCDMPCRSACPRQAFEKATYSRTRCDIQMKDDEARAPVPLCVKYCRACEMACPAGAR